MQGFNPSTPANAFAPPPTRGLRGACKAWHARRVWASANARGVPPMPKMQQARCSAARRARNSPGRRRRMGGGAVLGWACLSLAWIGGTSRRPGWSGRHASPPSPALLTGSGPRGGAAKACQEGFGLRCRGESGWCRDMTSTHGAWRHAGVRFLLSGECMCPGPHPAACGGWQRMARAVDVGHRELARCAPMPRMQTARCSAARRARKRPSRRRAHGRGRGAWACLSLVRIAGTSRSGGLPGCRAAPSSPALRAGSGPCGGAAEACQEGNGFRCRGESGWCSHMTSTHWLWKKQCCTGRALPHHSLPSCPACGKRPLRRSSKGRPGRLCCALLE